MSLPSRIDTVVIGAGQAGLTMSWFLREASVDHVVLERRAGLGGGWLDRWDAFRLVSPNWSASFPGWSYDGSEPDGFMPRIEIAGRVAAYAARIDAPVSLETEVLRLAVLRPGGFRLETTRGTLEAQRVVVAAGSFHLPRIPPLAAELPDWLNQLHTHEYRSESALPPGAAPRRRERPVRRPDRRGADGRGTRRPSVGRDRGPDAASLSRPGHFPVAPYPGSSRRRRRRLAADGRQLPDRRLRQAGTHVSGHRGGHDTNLRAFAAEGMKLLGRIERVEAGRLHLAADLPAQLASADRFVRRAPIARGSTSTSGGRGSMRRPDDRVPFDFTPRSRPSWIWTRPGSRRCSGRPATASITAGWMSRSSMTWASPASGAASPTCPGWHSWG